VFDHIGIRVKDLAASSAFYKTVLATLGHVPGYADDTTASFGPPGAPALWLYAVPKAGERGVHVAFRAADRAAVDRFYQAALKAGGRDNGPPGPRPDYSKTYYAAFVIDLEGNNIEAMLS
jgi:catechol 2,3-dioxygenase-like lactoylglutathione lyase family enzyme